MNKQKISLTQFVSNGLVTVLPLELVTRQIHNQTSSSPSWSGLKVVWSMLVRFWVVLAIICILPSQAQAQTIIKDYVLYPTTPFKKTEIELKTGDSFTVRQEGSGSIYVSGRTVPWISPAGDPGCTADASFSMSGVPCWGLIGKIGANAPFFIGANRTFTAQKSGTLFLAINHRLPYEGTGSWRIRVLHNPVPQPPSDGPTPFLDLPWDYQSKGMSFSQAAMSMSSYFDHEYPLLSVGNTLKEDTGVRDTVVIFNDPERSFRQYSSHDGFDYARKAQTKEGEPLLAPATGCAWLKNDCKACGTAILIDHGNYYQTRNYHMMSEDLITTNTDPDQCVMVEKGQMIGRVSSTGNVKPAGPDGSHIHFMVIEDKNKDGNFEDNIPDGLTDPFGWQGSEPDPWPLFSFNYLGQDRTGNDSHYLWTTSLKSDDTQGDHRSVNVYEVNKTKVTFPAFSLKEQFYINMYPSPIAKATATIESVSPTVTIDVRNLFNTKITVFEEPFYLEWYFGDYDLSWYQPESLTIYSTEDRQTWSPEETLIDWETQTASARITHLSDFGLFAELLETQPPTTTLSINDNPSIEETYNTPVILTLESIDNPTDSPNVGLGFTYYRLDNGEWELYTQPISLTETGSYTVDFLAEDELENVEDMQTVSFSLIQPTEDLEAQIFLDVSSGKLQVQTEDENIESQVKRLGIFKYRYTFTDSHDNTLIVHTYQAKIGDLSTMIIESLRYNEDSPIYPPTNSLTTYSKTSRGKLNLSQVFWIKDKSLVIANYNQQADTTKVVYHENGADPIEETLSGVKLLNIQTENGKLVSVME